jgi:sugar phosphate isomerase/epimerase
MLAMRTPLDALDDVDPDKILFVQLADFMWQDVRSPDERMNTARHFRVFPGEGVHSAEITALVRRLDDIGYRGDYSFEVFNDDYVQMPLATVAERARRSVRYLVSQVPRRSLPARNRARAAATTRGA